MTSLMVAVLWSLAKLTADMRAVTSTSGGEGYELLYKKAHSVEPVGRHIACFVPITDTARMQAESKISCNLGRS
jgi:hypothetical protein